MKRLHNRCKQEYNTEEEREYYTSIIKMLSKSRASGMMTYIGAHEHAMVQSTPCGFSNRQKI